MKKLVLAMIIFAAITGCKKEAKINEEPENPAIQDSVSVVENSAAIPFKSIELTPEETSKILAKQNNDTLYVTNFFATWCGPCMVEIPHFKEKMEELKNQPVKFTFVSLDQKSDWATKVKSFAEENNLSENIVLLDGMKLSPEFFSANFKEWSGESIPFTLMRKADKTNETVGMMTKDELEKKINSFK